VELLAERLGDRFGLLARSSPTIQPRQQTLRGAIDWSHELLGDDERALFRRLAVFRGGWTLEQCEELCVDDDGCAPAVVQLLGRLVQKSLVIAEHSIGSARYRMLSTIRQYASERLEESGEAQQLQDAHLALFTALAERLARDMVGERQAESLDRLELEQGNMRAALEWACGAGDTRLGLQLGAAIWKFWGIRGYWDAGQDVLVRLLALPDAQGCLAERARALTGRGNLVWAQGDFEAAKRDFEESLAISRELGDDAETAGCLRNLGLVAYRHGDYDSAQRLFEESLAIRRELGDQRGISHCLNNLGGIAVFRGDLESAKEYHEQSLEIRRRLNDERAVAIALNNLGEVVLRQGDRESARSMVEESLAIRRRLDDLWGMGSALHLLGVIDLGCDDESGSLSHEQESLTIRNRLGDKSGIAENLGALALLRSRSGETLRAARLSGAASALRDSIGGSATDVERHWQSETEATCRAALGDDGWRSATATGRALPLAQAVAEALE
jgi:tetratricopeptide (TPR) repeat protein